MGFGIIYNNACTSPYVLNTDKLQHALELKRALTVLPMGKTFEYPYYMKSKVHDIHYEATDH